MDCNTEVTDIWSMGERRNQLFLFPGRQAPDRTLQQHLPTEKSQKIDDRVGWQKGRELVAFPSDWLPTCLQFRQAELMGQGQLYGVQQEQVPGTALESQQPIAALLAGEGGWKAAQWKRTHRILVNSS